MGNLTRLHHDPLCPVCPSHDDVDCECECYCDFIADIRQDERRRLLGGEPVTTMVGGDDYGPEPHDPLCPRSDIEAAWNGADCHCVVIRLLRGIEKVDLERADFEAMWNKINDTVNDEGLGN